MLTCPCCQCDEKMIKVTGSAPDVWSASLIVRCGSCRRTFRLSAVLVALEQRADCGTEAGYQQHRRERSQKCDDCLEAHNAYHAIVRARLRGQLQTVGA